MQNSRFQSIRSRFSPQNIRTSLRRSSNASSRTDASRNSFLSSGSASPVEAINSVMFRQPSIVDLEAEKKSYGPELGLLEPRPIVYWGGVEERMASFQSL